MWRCDPCRMPKAWVNAAICIAEPTKNLQNLDFLELQCCQHQVIQAAMGERRNHAYFAKK